MSINRDWLEKDFYAVLGVPKNAPQAEIKKAYRKLAQRNHPDANAGDRRAEERFKEISAAYDVLGDEGKRREYDRVREMAGSGFRVGGPGGGGRIRFEDLGFEGGGLGDLFGGLFGQGGFGSRGGAGGERRGADLEAQVTVSFEDSISGTTVPLRVSGAAPCDTCGGSGARPGSQIRSCAECGGTGAVAVNQGFFSMSQTCPACRGRGRVVEEPCPTCRGAGSTTKTRTLRVKIPAGVEDGVRIRLEGRGEAGPLGGRAGDLYVVVRVEPHRFFGRRGADLTLMLPVTYTEAALGAKVQVPTLNGSVTLKVPSGTSNGRTFRVRGKGIERRVGGRGDLLVTVNVEVPNRLSKEERQLLERLQEAQAESPRSHLGVER